MHFLDLTLPTPAENLALDEALLLESEAGGGEALRLWEWPTPAVVLGAGCRLEEDVEEVNCLADGVPILRRASGGGTVLLGRGCLVYSLVLAYERSPLLRDIRPSYQYILGRTNEALRDVLPESDRAGISDLASEGMKFSGNAQQRKRTHVLHHGTLLYDFDLELVSRYLRLPTRQPEYRQGRGHEGFLRNLPVSRGELTHRLRDVWKAADAPPAWQNGVVANLVEEKYGRAEWTRRR